MNLPSGEISTALVDPHFRPSGSLKKPSMVVYGFGASLVGVAGACASTCQPTNAIAAATAANRTTFLRTDIPASNADGRRKNRTRLYELDTPFARLLPCSDKVAA